MCVKQSLSFSYYVVSDSLPFLLLEGLTEAVDKLVQFLAVPTQEVPDVLRAPQAVRLRWADLGGAGLPIQGPGNAQDAVALLLVIVEGLLKQDRDHRRSREAGSQQDLPVLDPDLLDHTDEAGGDDHNETSLSSGVNVPPHTLQEGTIKPKCVHFNMRWRRVPV